MDLPSVLSAYRRQAPFYDSVFGPLLGPGRRQTVDLINHGQGGTLLEVGVGTGLSLPYYARSLRIHGVDISPDMLAKAQHRVESLRLNHVVGLHCMDAEALRFPDNTFDVVAAMYIASVVPNPARMAAEIKRVCRPFGTIYVVNHFAMAGGARGLIERRLAPLSRKLGWRPDFDKAAFLAEAGLEVEREVTAPPLGLFTILVCRNRK